MALTRNSKPNAAAVWALTILIGATTLLAIAAASLPIFDYSLKEYNAYILQPSQDKLEVFQRKRREEIWVRATISITSGVCAVLLTTALARIRKPRLD